MTEARNFARVKATVDRRQKATIASALASSFVSGHDTAEGPEEVEIVDYH
jgi:hypothetical protein